MLNSLIKRHKQTVLFSKKGRACDCLIKPYAAHKGFKIKGIPNFVGATFDENGCGFFGDTFELLINADELAKLTDLTPVNGWLVEVEFALYGNRRVEFCVENAPIDRTLGMYLLKCSVTASFGQGKRTSRNDPGAI